jgi:hypothetical protein
MNSTWTFSHDRRSLGADVHLSCDRDCPRYRHEVDEVMFNGTLSL